jgi:hypothetical protein
LPAQQVTLLLQLPAAAVWHLLALQQALLREASHGCRLTTVPTLA